ncbi:MAG: cytochrome c biogenesis protein CcsA [Ignavibacteriae bacterium]|nr:cytochrome c biogenesis protein CcsA [Ignavibacteriota bacterium]
MLGKIFIYIAFISSVISVLSFFMVHLGKDKLLKAGRLFFHITAISIILASVFLMYLILTHQYQYAYVWEQSNSELQLPLLMSTFYSGQEGSFVLWMLFTAVIGIFLSNYVSKKDRLEPQVMSVFTLVLSFLTLIVILKSPFKYIWEAFPKEVEPGFLPPDGRGLNPLLQNFWMVIHPPILFVGFASLAVPFAFAIGTLMKNEYNKWVVFSMPWLLFSGGVLGLGIMLGGYWAYSILGWGGYWAWDPVENSSLIPWIIAVAGTHTMLVQKKTGAYKKTNLILSILGFLLVLYSTFLTRSGILGDSSVHSFVDPGAEVYLALVIFITSFILIAIIAISIRLKYLKSEIKEQSEFFTRETFLFLGSMVLCASALVITAGTSMPLLSKASIDTNFYNTWNMPFAIIILLTLGVSVFLEWKKTGKEKFLGNILQPLIYSVIVTVVLIFVGVTNVSMIILSFASLLAFFINLIMVIRVVKTGKANFGGTLAHVGIALFFLGVIGSAKYSEEVNLSLELNKPMEAFGFKFTYIGATPFMDANNKSDTMYHFNILVEKDNKEMTMRPVMYYSKFSQGVMKNPDIAYFLTKDLYVAPMSYDEPQFFSNDQMFEFKKGEKKNVGNLEVEFVDFDFGSIEKGGKEMMSGNYTIAATINISDGKTKETVSPKLHAVNGNQNYILDESKTIPGFEFYFLNMKLQDESKGGNSASIAIVDTKDPNKKSRKDETLVASVATKPFIWVLWTGVAVLVIGFFTAVYRRRKELFAKQKE